MLTVGSLFPPNLTYTYLLSKQVFGSDVDDVDDCGDVDDVLDDDALDDDELDDDAEDATPADTDDVRDVTDIMSSSGNW